MSVVTTHIVTEKEASRLARFIRNIDHETGFSAPDATTSEQIRANIGNGDAYVVATSTADVNAEPLGMLHLDTEQHLRLVYVAPGFQAQGIGRQLWEHAHRSRWQLSSKTAFTVNAPAATLPFFQKLGFIFNESINAQADSKYHAMINHRYPRGMIDAVYRTIYERRDMRHFLPDPVDTHTLARLLDAAHHAPSVGYMQPWRFIRITDTELRQQLYEMVEAERLKTADALGKRREEFMRLKVEGVKECGELLVVTLMPERDQYIFGRRTMPEMDLASASCAIQNLWLAARAEGLGMGWVSLFEPDTLKQQLNLPDNAIPIALLCLGHVVEFYDKPMLEQEGWDQRANINDLVMENGWHDPVS